MIFTNIWDLLKDMHASGSHNLLCADGVDGILGFGWVCQDTEKVWAISLANVARTGNQADIKDVRILKAYIANCDGRRKIVEMLDILFTNSETTNANL